jgi:hypothetical protein
MKLPNEICAIAKRKYSNNWTDWIQGSGVWPFSFKIEMPTNSIRQESIGEVRTWIDAWKEWKPDTEIEWTSKRLGNGGLQKLPTCFTVGSPYRMAELAGVAPQWLRSLQILDRLTNHWPNVRSAVIKQIESLLAYYDHDLSRLETLVDWLSSNDSSSFYIRQLPIRGVDTKWLEGRRKLVSNLMSAIYPMKPENLEFRSLPRSIRLLVLDPIIRNQFSGLRDLTISITEASQLEIPLKRVIIIENLQTLLALNDYPGTVAIFGHGYPVDLLGKLAWLRSVPCYYWGDIDTHGFAILDRARRYIPQLQSILMDETTLFDHRDLWSFEPEQSKAEELPFLTETEQSLYSNLHDNTWDIGVRMEQERLSWNYCMEILEQVLGVPC